MKNKFMSKVILLLSMFLLFSSCRQEQFNEKANYNPDASRFQLTSKRISLEDSKDKQKILPILNHAVSDLRKLKSFSVFNKTISFNDEFSIDTNDLVYIENGTNYHTYTFNVNRENISANAPVENVLLTPLPDGSYKAYLVTYNLTSEEKAFASLGMGVNTTGKTQFTELGNIGILNKLVTNCNNIETQVFVPCSGIKNGQPVHNDSNVNEWGNCIAEHKPYMYTVISVICTTSDDGTGGGGGGIGNPGGGGSGGLDDSGLDPPGGGSSNPICTTPNVPTVPIDPSMMGSDGCPIGVPTIPNMGSLKNPCEKIKKLFENNKFKAKFDSLTKPAVFSQLQEKAYIMRYPPIGTQNVEPAFISIDMPPCSTGDDDAVWPSTFSGITIVMHTHNNEDCNGNIPVKAPSPVDIRTLLNKLLSQGNTYTGSYLGAASFTMTENGTYMLIYDGSIYPGSINDESVKQLTKDYEKDFKKLFERKDNPTKEDIEKVFTKFLKEKINKPGLNVYRVTPNSKIKLEYDPTQPNSVKETPCP